MIPRSTGTVNAAAVKREALREQVWPGSSAEVWNRKVGKGFTTIPRTLGLVMTLIEELVERKRGTTCREFTSNSGAAPLTRDSWMVQMKNRAHSRRGSPPKEVCVLGRNVSTHSWNLVLSASHQEGRDRKVTS